MPKIIWLPVTQKPFFWVFEEDEDTDKPADPRFDEGDGQGMTDSYLQGY